MPWKIILLHISVSQRTSRAASKYISRNIAESVAPEQ